MQLAGDLTQDTRQRLFIISTWLRVVCSDWRATRKAPSGEGDQEQVNAVSSEENAAFET